MRYQPSTRLSFPLVLVALALAFSPSDGLAQDAISRWHHSTFEHEGTIFDVRKGDRFTVIAPVSGERPRVFQSSNKADTNIPGVLSRLMYATREVSGANPNSLEYHSAKHTPRYVYHKWHHTVNGAEIVKSKTIAKVSHTGELVALYTTSTPEVSLQRVSAISKQDAFERVRSTFGRIHISNAKLVFVPSFGLSDDGGSYQWWIDAERSRTILNALSGEIVSDQDNSRSSSSGSAFPQNELQAIESNVATFRSQGLVSAGSVSGTFEFYEYDEPGTSSTTTPLEYAYVELEFVPAAPKNGRKSSTCETSPCTARTDSNGDYSFTNLDTGDYDLRFRAETEWAEPEQTSGFTYEIEVTISGSAETEDVLWDNDFTPAGKQHLGNLAHAMEESHDFFAASPISYTGWNSQMDYDSAGTGSLKCVAKAFGEEVLIGDVTQQSKEIIYHEYSHNVIHDIYGDFIEPDVNTTDNEAAAMDEGLADYWAAAMKNDPDIGDYLDDISNCIASSDVRDLENTLTMDDWPVGGPHQNGQIISGAVWDLRPGETYATTSFSADDVNETLYEALQVEPDTFIDLGLALEDYWIGINPTHDVIDSINDSWDYREMSLAGHHKVDRESIPFDFAANEELFGLFPNPLTGGTVHILLNSKDGEFGNVSIHDTLGRLVTKRSLDKITKGSQDGRLDLTHLTPGLYFISVSTQDGTLTKGLVIQ